VSGGSAPGPDGSTASAVVSQAECVERSVPRGSLSTMALLENGIEDEKASAGDLRSTVHQAGAPAPVEGKHGGCLIRQDFVVGTVPRAPA
jgi:hypothetical protein